MWFCIRFQLAVFSPHSIIRCMNVSFVSVSNWLYSLHILSSRVWMCLLYPFPIGCILSTFYHPVYECVFCIRFQLAVFSPHSIIRCMNVSCWLQSLYKSLGAILIRCSLSFFGIISWMTLYQFALISPIIAVEARFWHIIFNSAYGHSFSTLISIVFVIVIAKGL